MTIGWNFVRHNGNLQAQPCGEDSVGRMLSGFFFFYHSNTEGCQLLEIMSGKGS